jgi:hypothetical protein
MPRAVTGTVTGTATEAIAVRRASPARGSEARSLALGGPGLGVSGGTDAPRLSQPASGTSRTAGTAAPA